MQLLLQCMYKQMYVVKQTVKIFMKEKKERIFVWSFRILSIGDFYYEYNSQFYRNQNEYRICKFMLFGSNFKLHIDLNKCEGQVHLSHVYMPIIFELYYFWSLIILLENSGFHNGISWWQRWDSNPFPFVLNEIIKLITLIVLLGSFV